MFSNVIIAAFAWRDHLDMVLGCFIGIAIVEIIVAILSKNGKTKASREAAKVKDDAEREAAQILREARVTAKSDALKIKDDALKIKDEVENEIKERRREIAQQEKRLTQKEENLDRKAFFLLRDLATAFLDLVFDFVLELEGVIFDLEGVALGGDAGFAENLGCFALGVLLELGDFTGGFGLSLLGKDGDDDFHDGDADNASTDHFQIIRPCKGGGDDDI